MLLTFMTMTKLKLGAVSALIVAAVAVPIVQQTRLRQLAAENSRLQALSSEMVALRQERDEATNRLHLLRDKTGADLLFQIFSQRYERGSLLITTNQAYKHWARLFNNDSTITSAVLDRVLHHAETVIIEGKSYRTKDQVDDQ